MATTLFEDKISEFLGIAEKASHGYYISNGVYHQNLENVNIDDFVIAVKTVKKMFQIAVDKKLNLIAQEDKSFGKEAFWNNLKRQQKRFEDIENNQLEIQSNKNNVAEILENIAVENQQVILQLKKAVEYNLTTLPVVFFRIQENQDKVDTFQELQAHLHEAYLKHNSEIPNVNYYLQIEIADEEEILSWFTKKEEILAQEKEARNQELEGNKKLSENEKQAALDDANKEVETQMAAAKKAQEDALKLMAEMQKKYGL